MMILFHYDGFMMMTISGQCSFSISPENRKPEVF